MEKPIIFSVESVKAILDGRKTMARRVIKFKPMPNIIVSDWHAPFLTEMGKWCFTARFGMATRQCEIACPYGQVGDRLWVRETWAIIKENDNVSIIDMSQNSGLYYKADMPLAHGKWRPSILMPRWASRLTLKITGVRVERLQEITEEDALAEGCPKILVDNTDLEMASACYVFEKLWDSLNAQRGYGWETNPWVWALKFDNIGMRVK